MRTIKFRGLRTDGNGWVYGNLINWHPTLNPRIVWFEQQGETSEELDFKETNYEVIPESVGQFTGIHDKNEKEIYEGDIVECKKTTNKFSYKFTSAVIMQYGCFGVVTDRFITLKDLIEGNIKIIGNIHENLELL